MVLVTETLVVEKTSSLSVIRWTITLTPFSFYILSACTNEGRKHEHDINVRNVLKSHSRANQISVLDDAGAPTVQVISSKEAQNHRAPGTKLILTPECHSLPRKIRSDVYPTNTNDPV